jgi:hypothetical protein
MKACCVKVIEDMQNRMEASKWLKAALVASPFVLLIGNHPVEIAADMLKDMVVEQAVEKLTDNGKLPDVADAVQSVDHILRNRLHQAALLHSLDHTGPEATFWENMASVYR